MPRLILAILFLAFASQGAGPFYVMTNGNNASDGLGPATAWLTIDKAISSAGTATIYVGQGYYKTNLTDGNPLIFSTANQNYVCSNNVVLSQVFFTANNVTLTNAQIGYRFFGGFFTDPVVWFKSGSEGTVLGGGKVFSAARQNQVGAIFDSNFGTVVGTEFTAFGPSGVCAQFGGSSNTFVRCLLHDNPSVEAVFYIWGLYHTIAFNTITNNNDVGLPGSHPDIFQSFFATSWGHSISNNLIINNNCQIGSLQAVNDSGGAYATNAGGWIFANNVFINQGSKLDVDFRDMQFINNTFYNCNNSTEESQVFSFNWSKFGHGTNCVVVNNLFALCGSDPTSTSQGWFGIDEGTNTSNLIRNSTTSSNNMVTGSAFAAKNTNSMLGVNWVNGGSPKFLLADATRIKVLNLNGTTSANATTNIIGTNTSFATQLSIGDHITLGPYWTDTVAQVVRIVSATNLWVDTPIGHGVNTKDGGRQSIQRVQGFDPVPNLRLLYGSPAIDVAATLANNIYDFDLTNRPVGPAYDIGAFEGPRQPDVPTNLIMWLTFNGWGGGTNVLDVTTNHANAALFLGSTWWPTPATNGTGGPDGSDGVHIGNSQFFGVTNVGPMQNLTNGTVAVWAQRTNGVGNGYGYILDCGYTFPATNGFTLGNDNGLPTSLYVTDPGHGRNTILQWGDFHSTNWHHYAFTWSNAVAVGYYDGVPFSTNNLPSQVLTLDDANWVCVGAIQHDVPPGGGTFPNAAFLMGYMTDVRYYNTALSAAEIANVYAIHALPTPPPVIVPGGSLPPQMLLHYTFQGWNGSSNVLDQTTNQANGITYSGNGPTLTNAFATNAAGHFANGQWLAVTNTPLFEYLTNGTLATWMKSDLAINSGDYYLIDGWYAFPETNCFSLGSPNSFATGFKSYRNSGTTTNMLFPNNATINVWHHYGVTWDGTNTTIYYDGTPRLTNAQFVTYYHVEDVSKWLAIGVQHGSHTANSPSFGWLNGSMADVRVYNYALSATNMARLALFLDPDPGTNSVNKIARVTNLNVGNTIVGQ